MFAEMWPLIQANIPDREQRIDFTGRLLELFVDEDMDPFDVEDIHPEIRAAMRRVDIEISEPDRYKDDEDTNRTPHRTAASRSCSNRRASSALRSAATEDG